MQRLKFVMKMVTNILFICYPFLIYLALRYGYFNYAIGVLIAIFILRLISSTTVFYQIGWLAKVLPCIGLLLALMSYLFSKYQLLLYYPVVINLVFLLLFMYSLKYPPTIIERFARIQQPNLPADAVGYTRKVTLCWCLFFIINGTIALATSLIGNMDWWVLYNGVISYILIAILMGGEWIVRKAVQR